MAFVRVEQRNAHLAGPVRLDYVNGRDGKVAKATLTAISNTRRSGEGREEEATAIQWTLWGRQAENAAEFLDKGSHVNVVGRLKNNNYRDASSVEVFGYSFTCEEIDYLHSKAESEARRQAQRQIKPVAVSSKKSRTAAPPAIDPDDIPF
jgi:single-strand DNA-binding protein